MNRIINSLLTVLLVGSPVFSYGGSTSLYLNAARQAEKKNDLRTAIYCLSSVLLEIIEKRPSAKGLNQSIVMSELVKELEKAKLHTNAVILKKAKGAELVRLIETELNIADPQNTITIYSDGTLEIRKLSQNSPIPSHLNISFTALPPTIYRPGNAQYKEAVASYWWFKMPEKNQIAKYSEYVPVTENSKPPGPDGAFK